MSNTTGNDPVNIFSPSEQLPSDNRSGYHPGSPMTEKKPVKIIDLGRYDIANYDSPNVDGGQ